MKARWWSCMLVLLCTPAAVQLKGWTASQNPSSVSFVSVNSSAEITCFTSLLDPRGLTLHRHFHTNTNVLYLSFKKGQLIKETPAREFAGRVHVSTASPQVRGDLGFTVRLSLLGEEDTNLYYCAWSYLESDTREVLSTNGTVLIVRGSDCQTPVADLILICLTAIVTSTIFFLCVGLLIFKCRQFRKKFAPRRVPEPPSVRRALQLHDQQSMENSLYLNSSVNTLHTRGFL